MRSVREEKGNRNKRLTALAAALSIFSVCMLTGCAALQSSSTVPQEPVEPVEIALPEDADAVVPTPVPAETPSPTPAETPTPTPMPTPRPTPAPTPTPGPVTATLGFIGDILMMTSQIEFARTDDGYDFSRSFMPMEEVFASVDLMCGNFECTFAGADAGWTEPRPEVTPTAENPNPKRPPQSFNAPDELAKNLRDAGFDLLTTANNHCIDRGAEGVIRTVRTIRDTGLMQTGTFLSANDRATPCIAGINGIKVGFVAVTLYTNGNLGKLSDGQQEYAVGLLSDEDAVRRDIQAAKDAGAEFVIVLPHWGTEYESYPDRSQEKYAEMLISCGADAIIGSHPHYPQTMEWMEVERDGVTVRVPVVYSLGNFISNMSPSPRDYGLFVRLTLTREFGGTVAVSAMDYLPCFNAKQYISGEGTLHSVLPCYGDASLVKAVVPLSGSDIDDMKDCYGHITELCGTDAAMILDAADIGVLKDE